MHEGFRTYLLNDAGKIKAGNVGRYFDTLLDCLREAGVEGRYLALATTKLEEACFFAKKSIATNPENQETP